MAETGSGQEKTEQPTGKKINEAREEGQVARSRELNTLIMLLVSGFAILFMGRHIIDGLLEILQQSFVIDRAVIFDKNQLMIQFWNKITEGTWLLLPFYIILVITAIAAPLPMSGWVFSTKALVPKINRMDPIKGLKNKVFSMKGLIELFKALIKFAIVAFVGYLLLKAKLPLFLHLGNGNLQESMAQMGNELIWVFIILSSSLIIIALVDVPFQLWEYKQQLKMTKQEVKDEYKDIEGNPEVKRKLKMKQMELAQRRMMEEVPKADVVITNPTHYAVAVRYDSLKMSAPIVVATGSDLIALQIRRVAAANDVPILEAPALARSLYHSTEIGQEIPAGLYLAVAQVLAYIYQIKHYRTYGGIQPATPKDFPIPEDLQRD